MTKSRSVPTGTLPTSTFMSAIYHQWRKKPNRRHSSYNTESKQ